MNPNAVKWNPKRNIWQERRIDETEMRLSILKNFFEMWKRWVNDPKLQNSIKSEEFQRIYADMSHYFTTTYLNGRKVSYHGRNILDPIQKTNTSAIVQPQNGKKEQPFSNNKISIQRAQEENRLSSAEGPRQKYQNNTQLPPSETPKNVVPASQTAIGYQFVGQLDFKLNRRYCSVCLRYIPATTYMVNQHVNSRDHQRTIKILMLIRKSKGAAPPPHIPWNLDPFMSEVPGRKKYHCAVCRTYPDAKNTSLDAHVRNQKHRECLLQIVRDYEIRQFKWALETDNPGEHLFIREVNKYKRYCLVCFCDVDSDKFSTDTHVRGANHQKRLQQLDQVLSAANTMFIPEVTVAGPPFKTENRSRYNFIGEQNSNNQRYCIACASFIPADEKFVIQHVNNIVHDTNVVRFFQKVDSVEHASYQIICSLKDGSNGQYCYLCNCYIGPTENDLEIHMQNFNHLHCLQTFSAKSERESIVW